MGNCTKYCALENAFNLPNAGHQNLPANVKVYHFIKQNHHCSPALTKRVSHEKLFNRNSTEFMSYNCKLYGLTANFADIVEKKRKEKGEKSLKYQINLRFLTFCILSILFPRCYLTKQPLKFNELAALILRFEDESSAIDNRNVPVFSHSNLVSQQFVKYSQHILYQFVFLYTSYPVCAFYVLESTFPNIVLISPNTITHLSGLKCLECQVNLHKLNFYTKDFDWLSNVHRRNTISCNLGGKGKRRTHHNQQDKQRDFFIKYCSSKWA